MPVWSGRFGRDPDPGMAAFTSSTDVDVRLLPHDAAATIAHAHVLADAGLLTKDDVVAIEDMLNDLVARWRAGEVAPSDADEDVHSFVERVLTEELGDIGRRIHAGRSRNDLVAADFRLWCRAAAVEANDRTRALIETICNLAEEHVDTLMPGFTHLQRAQIVSLGFHLVAHGCSFARDLGRFEAARGTADVSVLGAGALAGNTLELDPEVGAEKLEMPGTFVNAMDAVSDRDFAVDLAYASGLCAVHLSRLAEEIVLWTSSEFGFARLADEWSTGSSMMPQKRNPDVAELTRGKAATVIGDVTSLLSLLKGLPLAYDRDLQEDKAVTFHAVDTVIASLGAMNGLLSSLRFDADAMKAAAEEGSSWATDLAERLVKKGVPFREAHERVGALVRDLDEAGEDLTPTALEARGFDAEEADVVDVGAALERRNSPGGTAPTRVREQIAALRSLT